MINIKPLKAYTDNYIWLLETNEEVSIVDPGDAKPVLDYLSKTNKNIRAVSYTHLRAHETRHVSICLDVAANELINEKVTQGDTLSSLGIKFEIIEVPGHTLDHIAFYNEENDILFCGDTLFAGGCGRVFEGTFDQMFESLNKLKQLPDSTQIYCGHEYTKSNLLFSVEVEPKNNDLITYVKNIRKIEKKLKRPIVIIQLILKLILKKYHSFF